MTARRKTGLLKVTGVLTLVALSAFRCVAQAAQSSPSYSAQSIVNAATQTVTALAPNTIATIYGTNLAFSTQAVTTADVKGSVLPTNLGGVTVYVGGLAAALFYISPTQINFLVPYEYTPGPVTIIVARQGVAGPAVKVELNATSPGLFKWNGNYAIASHLSGRTIAPDAPAVAGEIVILYVVGLGRTAPDTTTGRVASSAAKIVALSQLEITLGGVRVPSSNVLYAGLAPGFAGLYQINVRLPDALPPDPEIRVAVGAQISPARIQLSALAAGVPIE